MFRLTPREFHYNPIGTVHGGVFATLLDSACGCAVHTMLPVGVVGKRTGRVSGGPAGREAHPR